MAVQGQGGKLAIPVYIEAVVPWGVLELRKGPDIKFTAQNGTWTISQYDIE